jgi:hypothetical protein
MVIPRTAGIGATSPLPAMKGWGIYEAARRKAEQLRAEQRGKPEPPQTEFAIGSMEWQAEQNKSS